MAPLPTACRVNAVAVAVVQEKLKYELVVVSLAQSVAPE
jgi:hypothetical protein